MYQFSYAEIMEEGVAVSKDRERQVLERSIVLLNAAVASGGNYGKEAVEAVCGVKVKAVNTTITKGKAKRFRGRPGERSDVKKAYVTLEEGNTIDVSSGL